MYFIPYFAFSFFLLVCSVVLNLTRYKKLEVFIVLLFFLFFGFSGYIGSDWFNYLHSYESYEIGDFSYSLVFDFFQFIFREFGFSFLHFKTFLFVLISVLIYLVLKPFNVSISLFLVFLISYAPLLLTDTYRNTIGILVFFYFLLFYEKKKTFLLLVLLFFLPLFFHVSLYLIFIFLLVSGRYYSGKVYGSLLLVAIVISNTDIVNYFFDLINMIGFSSDIMLRYSSYFKDTQRYGLTLGVVEKGCFFVLLTLGVSRYKAKAFSPYMFNFSILYCFLYVGFLDYSFVIQRVSLLFVIPFFITVLYGIGFFEKNIRFLILSIFVSILFVKISLGFNKPIYQYKNTLFIEECLECRVWARDEHYLIRE
ncbi:EpsG family protein [Ectopseudomonas chengduensis]